MERLTENVLGNIQLKACGNDFCKEICIEHDEEKSCNNCPIQKAFEKLAEYEDLEEQGKLLKLPCAVGDTYYRIENDGANPPYISEWEVRTIEFCVNVRDSIGKTVFLTRQEAEQALAEMEGKNGN